MRTFPSKSALLLLLSLFLSWQLFLDHVKRNVGLDCSLEDAGEIPQNLEKEDYMLIEGMCVCVCVNTHIHVCFDFFFLFCINYLDKL